MSFPGKILIVSVLASLWLLTPYVAQSQQAGDRQQPSTAGKNLIGEKCFQCHGDSMWKDHRQDRKGWEGVLYRMVGRGAVWTEEEVRLMADYLAETYGPAAKN